MITRVRVTRFKRFEEAEFDLRGDYVILAGPNNSGKSSLLQALSVWHLALRLWLSENGPNSKSGQKRRPVLIDEMTAVPMREMNLLWHDRHVGSRKNEKRTYQNTPIYIEVELEDPSGKLNSLAMEIYYANQKMVYVRPVVGGESEGKQATLTDVPSVFAQLNLAHVPCFSGIGTNEPRYTRGMQRRLIGEGKPGDVIRNLLLEIWETREGHREEKDHPWNRLCTDLKDLFGIELLRPGFSPDRNPYILCEYQEGRAQGKAPQFDIANAGSGFHQVLLLLAFFYSGQSQVLLLDEPDAHLHHILQGQIFDRIQLRAREQKCQLVMATHSEVMINKAKYENIIAFLGEAQNRISSQQSKTTLQDALRVLPGVDLLQAIQVRAVLWVEDQSDEAILREWARILGHAAQDFFKLPNIRKLEGKGNLGVAKTYFRALRSALPGFRGLVLLDNDNAPVLPQHLPPGMELIQWDRYEIENYLINPDLWKRFVRSNFGSDPAAVHEKQLEAFGDHHRREQQDIRALGVYVQQNLPSGLADFSSDENDYLKSVKGTVVLEGAFRNTSWRFSKGELYQMAALMTPEEISPTVIRVLDKVAELLGPDAGRTRFEARSLSEPSDAVSDDDEGDLGEDGDDSDLE